MAWFDEFLLGRGSANRDVKAWFNGGNPMEDERIEQIGPDHLITSQVERNAGTLGAATALRRTAGFLPDDFGRNASAQSIQPLPDRDFYHRLRDAGVQSGDTVGDVYSKLGQQRPNNQPETGRNPLSALFQMFTDGNVDSIAGRTGNAMIDGGSSSSRERIGSGGVTQDGSTLTPSRQRTARSSAEEVMRNVPSVTPGVELSYGRGYSGPGGLDALGQLLRRY